MEEKIKQFDIKALELGLDGEQMDELRHLFRKTLTSQREEIVEDIDKELRDVIDTEAKGYELKEEEENCCPGDDAWAIYERGFKDAIEVIKKKG